MVHLRKQTVRPSSLEKGPQVSNAEKDVHNSAFTPDQKKGDLSLAEYALSLIVLFGGWMVALFGIAGQVRPAGVTAFAITAAAGLGFVVFSWFIYGSNLQTLMWVADLMEDRVLRTRENWRNETLRSLVEVGSWLHIMFRIYAISESALVAAFCGSVVGAFCVVLGDYFTEYTREAEQRLLAQAEHGLVGYRYLRSLSGEESRLGLFTDSTAEGRSDIQNDSSSETFPEDQPSQQDLKSTSPTVVQEELASVFATPQFFSLLICFAFAASLYHVKDSQDLGVAVILTTLTNVAFITAEQLLMLWRPTRWAAVILHDRVMNVVYNWEHETIRSGFETCFYLSSIFSCYAFTENVPVAVLVGTLAGMSIVLVSSWIGIGRHPGKDIPTDRSSHNVERGIFMLAIFGWACATLLYTIYVYSRSSVLALGLVLPTGIAIVCLAEMAVSSKSNGAEALFDNEPSSSAVEGGAQFIEAAHCVDSLSERSTGNGSTARVGSGAPLKSKWSVFQYTLGSLLFPSTRWSTNASDRLHTLPEVHLSDVMESKSKEQLDQVKSHFSRKAAQIIKPDDMKGKNWVVIEGYVFDVDQFASHHPGGKELLMDYAKRQADVSDQFAAFHHPAVYNRLLPLLVGKLQEQFPSQSSCAASNSALDNEGKAIRDASSEYRKLRSYLWTKGYFDGAECDYESARSCANHHMIVLSLAVLAICQVALLSHNIAHVDIVERDSTMFTVRKFLQCTLAGITLGFFWQQVAFIAHDALHNGVVNRTKETRSKNPLVPNNVLGWFHGSVCFGISSAMWLDEHSVHHAMTMRPCQDAQFNYLPLWCVSLKEFSTRFWNDMKDSSFIVPIVTKLLVSMQHWTLLPLAVLIGRFNFYLINIGYAVRNKIYYDLAGMAAFWIAYVALLYQFRGEVGLQVCFVLVSHWTVGILHVQLLINHLATDAFTDKEEEVLEFFTFQVRTTRNIDSDEKSDWFHGGLQYQIEHHLFPQLPRHRLALVKPAVKDICERNGLTYESVSFFRAVALSVSNFKEIANEVWSGNIAL